MKNLAFVAMFALSILSVAVYKQHASEVARVLLAADQEALRDALKDEDTDINKPSVGSRFDTKGLRESSAAEAAAMRAAAQAATAAIASARARKTDGNGAAYGSAEFGASSEAKTLDDVVTILKSEGFEEPTNANAGLNADVKKKDMRILVHPTGTARGEPLYCFILAPGIRTGNQWCPAEIDGVELLGIRGFGKYGVVEYSGSKQYLSPDFFAGKAGARPSGIYGKNGMFEVKDVAIALDMLRTYEKERFTDKQLNEIEARLNEHTNAPVDVPADRRYLISSSIKMIVIRSVAEKHTYVVWTLPTP